VRRRVGIIRDRSALGPFCFATVGNSPVGAHSVGKSRRLPGIVVYVRPVGLVQVMEPSGRCWSRQDVQNVLSR
jgi:hypothetical protein